MEMIKEFMEDCLKVRVYSSRRALGQAAAQDVSEAIFHLLKERDEINMIFAAAPSQNEFLEYLSLDEHIPWERINAFHMDEYVGLSTEAPQNFGNFLRVRLFGQKPFKSVNYISAEAGDPLEECRRYAELLRAYPPDIVCMGIGENGHIAFNDPHVALFQDPESVKVVDLDQKCRQQQVNDKCFEALELVPENAVTLTIPALMAAPHIFCMVPGSTKAEAVLGTVKGQVSEHCPASILRTHEDAVLYLDEDSAKYI